MYRILAVIHCVRQFISDHDRAGKSQFKEAGRRAKDTAWQCRWGRFMLETVDKIKKTNA
ncbi:MAG: hypothetical protein LBG43_10120 [Treponema sp.]|nr:hypothetical protein [Treponema sp.]